MSTSLSRTKACISLHNTRPLTLRSTPCRRQTCQSSCGCLGCCLCCQVNMAGLASDLCPVDHLVRGACHGRCGPSVQTIDQSAATAWHRRRRQLASQRFVSPHRHDHRRRRPRVPNAPGRRRLRPSTLRRDALRSAKPGGPHQPAVAHRHCCRSSHPRPGRCVHRPSAAAAAESASSVVAHASPAVTPDPLS